MFLSSIFILWVNIHFIHSQSYRNACERNIYERCNHPSEFTDDQLNSVRVWLQNYMQQATIKPRQPPCKKLSVSKDFKCMTNRERREFVRVVRKLYENGVMDRLTDIHYRYWSLIHKSVQLGPWHRFFVNHMQQEMRKISPGITIPYYNAQIEASHPEKSMVWRWFGKSGAHRTGYCVTDGAVYSGLNTTRCLRRQWKADNTIPVIDGLELATLFIQLGISYVVAGFIESGLHFNTHLALGGYRGDMSVDSAPFDISFHLWHNYHMNIKLLKHQLMNPSFITPLDHNIVPQFDQSTGQLKISNIETDRLIYYNTSLVDNHHVGFGELCTLPDQIVDAILQRISNKTVVPLAAQRMPSRLKKELFPHFVSNQINPFSHMFEEVGDCNRECRPIPRYEPYVATENGKRLLRRYRYDLNFRADWLLMLSQALNRVVVDRINRSGYCSPYVTN